MPFQELPPGPVGPVFRKVDDLPGLRVELVTVAEIRAQTRAYEQAVLWVHAEIPAVEQGVDIRPEQQPVVESVLPALGDRPDVRRLQAWAGVTRTGYHGTRVDGREPGRFEPAGLIVTSWLQGTSRDGDPQDHVHNQIARITRTFSDGKWRALDTMSVRGVLGALQAIAATAVECELTAEFGVAWVPRADGRGNEIAGVTQAQMDAYSTRTVQVHEKERELARAWERKHGRAPTSRELLYIANDATLQSRRGKDAGPVDWDALAARWDATTRRRAGRHRARGVERARPGRTGGASITVAARRPDRPRGRPRHGRWPRP